MELIKNMHILNIYEFDNHNFLFEKYFYEKIKASICHGKSQIFFYNYFLYNAISI